MELDVRGQPLHTRSFTIRVLREDTGVVRVSGDILDLRKCGFVPLVDEIQGGGIVHHMRIEWRVATATREILTVGTDQPYVAVEPSHATGGDSCREPAGRLGELVGTRLDAGFAPALSACFGGRLGCSHLLALSQLAGPATERALDWQEQTGDLDLAQRVPGERILQRSLNIDAAAPDETRMHFGLQLADTWSRPKRDIASGLERLGEHVDVRVGAEVERASLSLVAIDAAERALTQERLQPEWRSRSADVAPYLGQSLMAGISRRLLEDFGDRRTDRPLRDTLLSLAPTYIQALAAVAHAMLVGAEQSGGVAGLGGRENSCYLWRDDGPLIQIRTDPSSETGS